MEKLLKRNGHFVDITESRFEKLIVLEDGFKKGHEIYCYVKCDCGNKFYVRKACLKNKNTRSCGCIHREQLIDRNTSHMMSNSKIYIIYHGIISRCYRKTETDYYNYGGRGIIVCDEWVKSFESFRDWAFSNGYKEGLSIERINVNGNYCPENCTWIPRNEQALNKRNSVFITINGIRKNMCVWMREFGIKSAKPYVYYKKYGEEFVIQKYFK
jgi:hypothetical protein